MSTRAFNRVVLVCDGCGAEHGAPHGDQSAMEARVTAYADGWRFPTKTGKGGKVGVNTSDMCPECVTDTPQPA